METTDGDSDPNRDEQGPKTHEHYGFREWDGECVAPGTIYRYHKGNPDRVFPVTHRIDLDNYGPTGEVPEDLILPVRRARRKSERVPEF